MVSAFFGPFSLHRAHGKHKSSTRKGVRLQQGQQRWPGASSTGGIYPEMASPGLGLGPPTVPCDSTTALPTAYESELKSRLN